MFRLMGQRRGLAGVVIPCHGEYATIARSAKRIRVFDDVHTSVDARAFAVPHAKNTIEARALE